MRQLRVSSFEFRVTRVASMNSPASLGKRLALLGMRAEEYVRLSFDRALERRLRGGAGLPLAGLP